MIYLEPRVLGWRPLVESWVNGEIAEPLKMYKHDILALFDFFVPQCLGMLFNIYDIFFVLIIRILNRSRSTCNQRIESNR